MIAEIKKRDAVIEEITRALEEEKRSSAEKNMVIDLLERHLMIYENVHSPPFHGSVPAQQKKTRSANGPNRHDR